jgi:hypothetical protein
MYPLGIILFVFAQLFMLGFFLIQLRPTFGTKLFFYGQK